MTGTLESIRYTADVVAVTPGGRVLLIERGWPPYRGRLALPGWHVDPGETSRDAAARELLEETGVAVAPADLVMVGVYDAPGRDPRGRYVTVAYTITVPDTTTATAGDDAAAARWVSLDAASDVWGDSLAFDHARIITDAIRQRTTSAYAQQAEQETSHGHCPAAHPWDHSPCGGPVAVTVVDAGGAGVDGCEHHAARMLASVTGTRVYGLPDAPEGAAVRVFKAASGMAPFAWLRGGLR